MANTTGKKFGGRQKGTANKITTDMRKLFSNFAWDNFSDFERDWKRIKSPEAKAKLYLEACKFVIPALQSVSFKGEVNTSTIEGRLKDLAESENVNK